MSPELAPRYRHAALVSASLVNRSDHRLAEDFQNALREAFSVSELVELILQSLLFDGYPCALEGLILLKNLLPDQIPVDEIIEAYSRENVDAWKERGEALCRRIYGKNYDRLLENVESLSPSLREWMLREGYGRILARPALNIAVRELGIIAILTVKGLSRQLHSHLFGALHVGVSSAELEKAIQICAPYTSPDRIQSSLEICKKLSR
ncbi:MAG: carboxymuconolactone decarboxylase family protein [bacterium]|nr:carboxymuconolactone decarboxylase family protein [bacterium]